MVIARRCSSTFRPSPKGGNTPVTSINGPRRRAILAAGAGLLAAPAVRAQPAFPNRPLRMIIPFAPGGGTDLQMRALCDAASRRLGQPIVIENRSGGGAILGAMALVNDRSPDGHLLSQMPSNVFSYPLQQRNAPFDPVNDFSWIIQITGYVFGIAVRADSPFRTLADLIEHARKNPGRVSYGSTSVGGVPHLTTERIAEHFGVEMTNVPYRGGHESITAVINGTITAMSGSGWTEFVRNGQMRALCSWGPRRLASFPDVPTLKELGVDIVQTGPYGFAGPKNLPANVVATLHDAFRDSLNDPAHLAVLASADMEVDYLGPRDYAASVARIVEQNRAVLGRLGLLAG
ncbi:tripartite tricarboxylate transporter substrate binding protein [Roseomonas soli]|uniref:Tripartite tricarboxylate transporter substrate binding protein n=2 Tax=Neoroseomonas soli TaxID=1081025 RepID=A0A9X9WUF8_9PROT|nr:tripartite tricarboxylate transporter substrate binding protein [Neoroseomonas soli]